jgi:hypothetical protein
LFVNAFCVANYTEADICYKVQLKGILFIVCVCVSVCLSVRPTACLSQNVSSETTGAISYKLYRNDQKQVYVRLSLAFSSSMIFARVGFLFFKFFFRTNSRILLMQLKYLLQDWSVLQVLVNDFGWFMALAKCNWLSTGDTCDYWSLLLDN